MKHPKESEATPQQYRSELLDQKQKLQAELNSIKASMAMATVAKDQQRMAELASDRSEIVTEIAEIDCDLRQLKQEIQPPSNSMGDLNLIVQIVAAEINYSGTFDPELAIARLSTIKAALATPPASEP